MKNGCIHGRLEEAPIRGKMGENECMRNDLI